MGTLVCSAISNRCKLKSRNPAIIDANPIHSPNHLKSSAFHSCFFRDALLPRRHYFLICSSILDQPLLEADNQQTWIRKRLIINGCSLENFLKEAGADQKVRLSCCLLCDNLWITEHPVPRNHCKQLKICVYIIRE